MRKFVLMMVAAGMGMAWACVAAAQEASQPASELAADRPTEATSGSGSQPTATQGAGEEDTVKVTAEARTQKILEALALTDPAAEARVRDVLVAFHVKRITWGPNDDRIKDLDKQLAKAKRDGGDPQRVKELTDELEGLRGELAAMCEAFLAELGKTLTAEQIDTVKDVMTYGRAKIVYNKYTAEHDLTDAQKAVVAKLLAEARDQAWMAGSAPDKHKMFDKAVGRVNIYLDALKKLEVARSEIQAGRLSEAEALLVKIERRDWLREAMGQALVDARRALEGAKAAARAPQPLGD